MSAFGVEITCQACGSDALLRREPKYEGFRKTGEQLLCSACGHEFKSEEDVPFKAKKTLSIFTEEDVAAKADVFRADEKGRLCRYCEQYVVNPFTQRCGLHDKVVEATDSCEDFTPKEKPRDHKQ
jgi:hypothetical protein